MNSEATLTDTEASKSETDVELDNLKEKEKEIFNVENDDEKTEIINGKDILNAENDDEKTEKIIEKESLNPSEIQIEDNQSQTKHNEWCWIEIGSPGCYCQHRYRPAITDCKITYPTSNSLPRCRHFESIR